MSISRYLLVATLLGSLCFCSGCVGILAGLIYWDQRRAKQQQEEQSHAKEDCHARRDQP